MHNRNEYLIFRSSYICYLTLFVIGIIFPIVLLSVLQIKELFIFLFTLVTFIFISVFLGKKFGLKPLRIIFAENEICIENLSRFSLKSISKIAFNPSEMIDVSYHRIASQYIIISLRDKRKIKFRKDWRFYKNDDFEIVRERLQELMNEKENS